MNQVAHKIAPAIASNAPVLLKPSDKTPLSALKLVEILYECGLPEGMVNVVISNDPKFFLKTSLESNVFDVVTFTGGVDVGRYISRKIAETENNFIKFIPELGGNPAITILEDADIKVAVRSALNAFENSGQRCTSVKRILLHNDIADRFIDSFLKEVKRIYYGNPLDYETDMGTLIDENSALIIEKKVNNAIRDGAKLLFGNQRRGALYSPTVLDYVSIESELVITETFGPVAPIIRINSIDEAIDIINSVPYKLAGSAITKDVNKAKFISDSIQVGQFNWNNNPGFRTEMAPFGGFGVSGNGEKEGVILAAEGFRKVRTFYEHIT
jgi:aldehyde dehydrogenase (NAD+)